MKLLSDNGELERLNEFCSGKTVARIDHDGDSVITLHFTDGSSAELSTLGAIEIEELRGV